MSLVTIFCDDGIESDDGPNDDRIHCAMCHSTNQNPVNYALRLEAALRQGDFASNSTLRNTLRYQFITRL
jgi:hypothetical protein